MQLDTALRQWIGQQLDRGCDPGGMIETMVVAGHPPPFARQAIDFVRHQAPIAKAVPAPLSSRLASSSSVLATPDRDVAVLLKLEKPDVLLLDKFLSDAECDALIAEAAPKLARSKTVDPKQPGLTIDASRTSEDTHFAHDETPLLARLNARIAAVTRWPLENGEPLHILRYGVGARYEPHYDFFDANDSGAAHTMKGGQRVATLIIYLNTPEMGGATVLLDLGLEIAARKGNALFFSYPVPNDQSLTLHAGAPVLRGEKWIATRWLRERAYR